MKTLNQWAAENKVHVSDHESGCKVVAGEDMTTDMFHLSDYVVTSYIGGVYWLKKLIISL